MASSSPSLPSNVVPQRDDDEFDWEAALKEIDVACQGVASASNQQNLGNPTEWKTASRSKKSAGTRQSTLDVFVQTEKRCPDLGLKKGSAGCRGGTGDASMGYGVDDSCNNIDLEASKTWIYPVNVPLRDYQLSIAKTALFSNTLVALPTGLGKTLIAAVVMYNYFRWFPEGKIVFTAPSRPLVMQQIEACHNIVGIPQEWTIDMTGQMNPSKRSYFWKAKRVFFVTPQVLEKDIQSGTCLVKQLVCLVIDEAHRAMGNYSYCVAVRELMAVPVRLRILALTATPGSKKNTIQNVIDNLHISTLEYRNESDHDVVPYVHNRKLELMEVAMHKDAVGINDLLLEVIRPFVARLAAAGILYKRDIATLSPCDLLNARDKFRQEPPLNLPHIKFGEIEGYFGVLITLYHIRKLLSSHGIRPAYEMLEEKLQQGSFSRLMIKNETIWRMKLLMQKSLSHGAPNPKLLKMREVLLDHFKTNDPKDSRVIIFSNFRGSVKDIMDSLSNIGQFVKATQFVGQSSGKSFRGQSQKVQQEVLQKFRAGGYNVIVATSIGEEGLDIMEVDLVICFDANISPLRMIQRMGRTGRKHDGRVVVLACEGAELKGYLKKQANSKAVKKHMHNGGTNSFDFHPSPRMVPHICKPEVQFVEMSIELFVPRGRKVKDMPMDRPSFREKMTDAETDIIAKYFHSCREERWRPSLIAFPHFQACPSRVHKVKHSFRTTRMLIDTMQSLQGLSSGEANKALPIEVKAPSAPNMEDITIIQDSSDKKGFVSVHNAPKTVTQNGTSYFTASPREASSKVEHCMPDLFDKNPPVHCFLFSKDFLSVNASGKVLIASVPALLFMKDDPCCRNAPINNTVVVTNALQDVCDIWTSLAPDDKISAQPKYDKTLTASTQERFVNNGILTYQICKSNVHQEQTLLGIEKRIVNTPTSEVELMTSNGNVAAVEMKSTISPSNGSGGNSSNMDLSPRLTSFIEKGVVPESPVFKIRRHFSMVDHMVHSCVSSEHDDFNAFTDTDRMPSQDIQRLDVGPSSAKSDSAKNEIVKMQKHAVETNKEMQNISGSPVVNGIHTPIVNKTASSPSDWQLSSEEPSIAYHKAVKFRRLCKIGDADKRLHCKTMKEDGCETRANLLKSFTEMKSSPMKHRSNQRSKNHVAAFIEEEAEVSSDAEVSGDEEDDMDSEEYDDGFIDDRINPTMNAQGASGIDMMAIYRRSLLTQSPLIYQPSSSPNSCRGSPSSRTAENGSCSAENINNACETRLTDLHSASQYTIRNSVSCQLVGTKTAPPQEHLGRRKESRIKIRKRKLSFQEAVTGHEENFQHDCLLQSEVTNKMSLEDRSGHNELKNDAFYDDEFYDHLNLDEVEAEATKSLMYKSKLSMGERQKEIVNPCSGIEEDLGLISLCSPSFDLGF